MVLKLFGGVWPGEQFGTKLSKMYFLKITSYYLK